MKFYIGFCVLGLALAFDVLPCVPAFASLPSPPSINKPSAPVNANVQYSTDGSSLLVSWQSGAGETAGYIATILSQGTLPTSLPPQNGVVDVGDDGKIFFNALGPGSYTVEIWSYDHNNPRAYSNPTILSNIPVFGAVFTGGQPQPIASDFSKAPWVTESSSILNVTTNLPNGMAGAQSLIEDKTNALHRLSLDVSMTPNVLYTFSVAVQSRHTSGSGSPRDLQLIARESGVGNVGEVTCNPETATADHASVVSLNNGWYLCTMSFTPLQAENQLAIILKTGDHSTYGGDGVSGLNISIPSQQGILLPLVDQNFTDQPHWQAGASSIRNWASPPIGGPLQPASLFEDKTDSQHRLFTDYLQLEPNALYAFSVSVKDILSGSSSSSQNAEWSSPSPRTLALIDYMPVGGIIGQTTCRPQTGLTVWTAGANSTLMPSLGNGWYRCTLFFVPTQTVSSLNLKLYTGDWGFHYKGDGASGLSVANPQLFKIASHNTDFGPSVLLAAQDNVSGAGGTTITATASDTITIKWAANNAAKVTPTGGINGDGWVQHVFNLSSPASDGYTFQTTGSGTYTLTATDLSGLSASSTITINDNGKCGADNGLKLPEAPINLCAAESVLSSSMATSYAGWSWSCKPVSGGATTSCAAENSEPGVITLATEGTTPIATIPSDFVGVSYDVGAPYGFLGNWFTPEDKDLIALLKRLGPSGSIRIGGSSSNAVQASLITTENVSALHSFMQELGSGWTLIWGLNIYTDNAIDATREVGVIESIFGSGKVIYQIGNESDGYTDTTKWSWGLTKDNWLSTWGTYYNTIHAAYPAARFGGPDIYNSLGTGSGWIADFLNLYKDNIAITSQHLYTNNVKNVTLENDMQSGINRWQTLSAQWNAMNEALQTAAPRPDPSLHLPPMRATETNDAVGGGVVGISNGDIGIAWTVGSVDFLAQSGWAGINIHASPIDANYSPLHYDGTAWEVWPKYYGMVLASAANGAGLLPLMMQGQDNMVVNMQPGASPKQLGMAFKNPRTGNIQFLVTNGDITNPAKFRVMQEGSFKLQSILIASGPSASSLTATLGGAPVNPDGSWAGAPTVEPYGTIFTLPPASAALVTIQ